MWRVLYDVELNRAWYNFVDRFSSKIPGFSYSRIRENFEFIVFDTYKNTTGTVQEKNSAAVNSSIQFLESLIH